MAAIQQGNIAFIPLRAGSKGIPGKNVKLMAGLPLFSHAVNAAVESGVFQKVVIATNDQEVIRLTSQLFPSSVVEIYVRGTENATDTASTESVMFEYVDHNSDFETFTLIQATSPLVTANDLKAAFSKFSTGNYDSLLSAVRQKRFVWAEVDEVGEPQNYDPLRRPRRQEFNGYLVENGAFYITKKTALIKSKNRISGRAGLFEMPEESYYEIDEPADWDIVERLMKRRAGVTGDWSEIKLVLTDVDGVLTDAGMYYSETGDELKKFNTRDGKGFELLRNKGILTGIITSEDTRIVSNRASKLKVNFLHQGVKDKLSVVKKLLIDQNLTTDNVAYIGDDINDLEVLGLVKYSFCPYDGQQENIQTARYHLSNKGGEGCFREMVEMILKHATK